MHPSIEVLQSYNIPTGSSLAAVQHVNSFEELSEKGYVERIKEMTNEVVSFVNQFMYRYTYLYLIQNTIKASLSTDKLNVDELLKSSVLDAEDLIAKNPWFCFVPEIEPVLDSTGKPKPKKGAKKVMAKQAWDKYKDDGVVRSRQDWIAILVEEVGLTKLGASTYYANLKKGTL